MSMYSTKMSLGSARGVGAKLMMLLTPARTRVSAASWATSPGTVSTAIWTPRSRTSSSMSAASTQRTPWTCVSMSAGSTSNAATIATDGLLSAKCESTACPRLPTPASATSCCTGPSRKLPMLSMQAATS